MPSATMLMERIQPTVHMESLEFGSQLLIERELRRVDDNVDEMAPVEVSSADVN